MPAHRPPRVLVVAVLAGLLAGNLLLLPSWEVTRPAEAREPLPGRKPGTIRIEGDPDQLAPLALEVAFPLLRFRRPLWIGEVPDGSGRLWVLEQGGTIRSFDPKDEVRGTELVVDLSEQVYRGHNEEGLLGLAFSPDFKRSRELFLHYSAQSPRRGVIARFKTSRDYRRIEARSERTVLEQRQPWGNHNGGGLEFGPDGFLYISFGDGGAANDRLDAGQDLGNWLGTILRIDVAGGGRYKVPRDNPFVSTRGARPEIWAYGLRNVWRFSFDRLTGTLWAGDVGQNTWEEINIVRRGGNYGWRRKEGFHRFRREQPTPDMIDPVVAYPTSEGRSVTGGVVYRGARFPHFQGTYLYADYASGNVWGLRYDGARVTRNELLARGRSIASFGEDASGEVYLCSFDGRIYRLAVRKTSTRTFPRRLSETGLFTNTAALTPDASLIPYEVNAPLWSDGAEKRRWILLPGMQRTKPAAGQRLSFPLGTIFVKHFEIARDAGREPYRLETRVMVLREDGWGAFTYVWADDQEDAVLTDGRARVELPGWARTRHGTHWTAPSRSDCMACHTAVSGFVLGFEPRQLVRPTKQFGGSRQQWDVLRGLEVLPAEQSIPPTPFPDTRAEETSSRAARAYLHSNCAMCHQPGAPGNATLDLRFETPLNEMGALNQRPGQGDLGIRDARLVAPGDPARSLLLQRMRRTDEKGMPNIAHERVDAVGVSLVDGWIRSLSR